MTPEENERLTRVGPGTPMGALLRRYWWPVASADEALRHPTIAVRLLGEAFVLFRDARGRLALVGERCPHRGASLRFGVPDDGGLRCAYHGWRFDFRGRCTEVPGQREGFAAARDVSIPSHPVEECGGLLFAYLGPEPAPPLPRWDLLLERGVPKEIASVDVPCNWLQILENNLDDHLRWLHVGFHEFARAQSEGAAPDALPAGSSGRWPGMARPREDRPAPGTETPWGFEWSVPMLFPTGLVTGQGRLPCLQIRVPVDDVRTRQWFYTVCEVEPDAVALLRPHLDAATLDGSRVPHHRVEVPAAPAETVDYAAMTDNIAQDVILVTSQGPVHDRTREVLTAKDAGIAFYRSLLRREVAKVERGEEPIATFRDRPAGEALETPRLPAFASTELRGVRARPGERPLENVQARSPLLALLSRVGVDPNALKFETRERPRAAATPVPGASPAR